MVLIFIIFSVFEKKQMLTSGLDGKIVRFLIIFLSSKKGVVAAMEARAPHHRDFFDLPHHFWVQKSSAIFLKIFTCILSFFSQAFDTVYFPNIKKLVWGIFETKKVIFGSKSNFFQFVFEKKKNSENPQKPSFFLENKLKKVGIYCQK